MSAPASIYRLAWSIAAENPSTAQASVRAIMTRPSRRASTAALTLPTISSAAINSLPAKWPQRFGACWSSSCMALAPAAPELASYA